MSFGLPLHDRILKWQLVSRVDSVSPVRGKKSETRGPTSVISLRTVMKEWDGSARKAGLFIMLPKAACVPGSGQL